MKYRSGVALLPALLFALPLHGETVTELSRTELRRVLAGGTAEDPRHAMVAVRQQAGGQIVDIRAFRGKAIYYRVLVKKPDGLIVSLVINAESGSLLTASSTAAISVNAAAKGSNATASETDSTAAASASSAAHANANAGMNGNARSDGNGNFGGNGNAGGNGKGNAGGNGNGNGK